MNRQEAAKLLSLVKLSYPTAYRDIDRETANATVNMWAASFAAVPYAIMERAFDRYRMASKFPPTVAEMACELKKIHYQAEENALMHKSLGNEKMVNRLRWVMDCTAGYKNDAQPRLWGEIGGKSMGRPEIPEHPEVEWALRTGYPSWMQERNREDADEDRIYEENREGAV